MKRDVLHGHQLRVVTWNVLAAPYVFADWYPYSSVGDLDQHTRGPSVVSHVKLLLADADVVLLQEVTLELANELGEFFDVRYMQRLGHADGVAIVAGGGAATIVSHESGCFAAPALGRRVWIAADVTCAQRVVRLVSVHLDWGNTPSASHNGVLQARELAELARSWVGPTLIGGDFNAAVSGVVGAPLRLAGFRSLLADGTTTAVVRGEAVELDAIVARGLSGCATTTTRASGPLPGPICPSDHVPVAAVVTITV